MWPQSIIIPIWREEVRTKLLPLVKMVDRSSTRHSLLSIKSVVPGWLVLLHDFHISNNLTVYYQYKLDLTFCFVFFFQNTVWCVGRRMEWGWVEVKEWIYSKCIVQNLKRTNTNWVKKENILTLFYFCTQHQQCLVFGSLQCFLQLFNHERLCFN